MQQFPSVSIVIPAHNEEAAIGACLEAICELEYPGTLEVIVVDNGSADRTAAIARSFAERLPLRVVTEPRRGRGAARHAGCKAATGDMLFCTDADAAVPRDWVTAFLRAFENPSVVAVTSPPAMFDIAPMRGTIVNTTWPIVSDLNHLVLGHVSLVGASMAVRRSAYEKAGGFDPRADAFEDLDLAQRLSRIGIIVALREPRVSCSGRRFERGLLRGFADYMIPYVHRYVLRKKRAELLDVR